MSITLNDKYQKVEGRVFLNGAQTLVRIAVDQARRDAAGGLKTAGFISGYRGSPLGNFDTALWHAESVLRDHNIVFQPGVNEDLAATAVWGSQQAATSGAAKWDGVFSLWYGKGPGVDRSADAIKHGNFAGTSRHGGVLVLCGDDHAARSSTVAHQSDQVLIHCGLPVLNPSNLQDCIDYGAFGFALSRYSANWIGFKCITDTIDSSASVLIDPSRSRFVEPDDYRAPPRGLWIRNEVAALAQESRLFEERLLAAQAFVRANGCDRTTLGPQSRKRLGIVTSGKAHNDVAEALRFLRLGASEAEQLGIGIYKVAMVWPLEPIKITQFASQCDEVLVIEEKRGVIEPQLASLLYNLPAASRPRLSGKRDLNGRLLISEVGELNPGVVLSAIVARYDEGAGEACLSSRLKQQLVSEEKRNGPKLQVTRAGAFCAGCPHNLSTRVPEGSVAAAGIGCHGMASLMPERHTAAGVQMGGEGAQWIGQAPFVSTGHIFQNLGDGTYFHSGLLAIRACVAAKVNITYKILLNGVVGMTGGQQIEGEESGGEVSGANVAHQVHSEGVERIAVVADDPGRISRGLYPDITTFHHRDSLDAVQRELRDHPGVSVIIYDQACATERRRMRKRGKVAPAATRLFINSKVCEGCGDCGLQSNCIALEPVETEFGRKRRINQSVCNQDYSCLKGFCPSFVTVTGGKLRRRAAHQDEIEQIASGLQSPELPPLEGGYALLLAGIGGSGIVTIGAIMGMAAHLDGTFCSVLDMSGFAQRNGSVTSHVRFAPQDGLDHTSRIPPNSADVIVATDAIVATSPDCLDKMNSSTKVIINGFVAPTSAFAQDPNWAIDVGKLEAELARHTDGTNIFRVDASELATQLLGDAIGGNLLLVGYAWQLGYIPLSLGSIMGAIELNGAAVHMNRIAFKLGRVLAAKPDVLKDFIGSRRASPEVEDLDQIVARQERHLTHYQNQALAERYLGLVARVADAERALRPPRLELSQAVAITYAKLLSYKDEYEVARLFTDGSFHHELAQAFEGDFKISYNLAPPFLPSRAIDDLGRLRKHNFGGWAMWVFKLLAKMKGLRGTPFDVFGYHHHRRHERGLIMEFEALVEDILPMVDATNILSAIAMVRAYENIRGYGPVKEVSIAQARSDVRGLRKHFEAGAKGELSPL